MREARGELFDQLDADAICITTNGYIKASGENVMGRGCAGEAAKRWPMLPKVVGEMLALHGNVVRKLTAGRRGLGDGITLMGAPVPYHVVMFPVKPDRVVNAPANLVKHMVNRIRGYWAPGWAAKADLDIIARSAAHLAVLATTNHWTHVVIPRPGCGAGELLWTDVQPVLRAHLDDRFVIITR